MPSDEEKGRRAIDVLTKNIKEFNEKHGREMSHDQAQKKAKEIAYRAEKKAATNG